MNIISCPSALIGCNESNFNLTTKDVAVVKFPCKETYILHNKEQKTYGVFDNETDELISIGYQGHGCVIFDNRFFGRDEFIIIETIYRMSL